ncbi:MAG: L-rhamnose mutarotase [Segetibacter sp.]|nr:L-rhamnose mutarotase [Segetibacter sp.]
MISNTFMIKKADCFDPRKDDATTNVQVSDTTMFNSRTNACLKKKITRKRIANITMMLPYKTFLFITMFFASTLMSAAQIYVATNGSDHNDGSKEKPFASVATALRHARELRRLQDGSIANGIHIIVKAGVYKLYEPIFIRTEDSGTPASPTIIEAATNETPVLSGGVNIMSWRKPTGTIAGLPKAAQGKVWVANAPVVGGDLLDFRQLWINNIKGTRARDKNADSMFRILSWNHKTEQCWIPKPAADITKVEGLEMFIHQWWAVATLRVKSVEVSGDSARLTFHQPESRVQSEHPWPAPWISSETGNSAFYLTNAIEFLDEPGEWFLDKLNRKLYYWPRNNENLSTATVTAPSLETLVKMEGTIDHPVTNVHFKGISFQHTSWLRPSKQGHVPHQIGMYMLEAYKLKIPGTPDKKTLENQAWVGRPTAAVEVSYANNTSFEDCRFEHLASSGLDYHKAVHNNSVKGNVFKDVGGTAILAGVFSDEATEVHLPYNPKDEREVSSNITISNNLINNVANEDWGCVGIAGGYIKNSSIGHNDISEVPYMGISLGWGWTRTLNAMQNNKVTANKIHRYAKQLYDVAGIYTLSAQPGTTITENYIDSAYKAPYAHLPSHWFYLYTDEGSSYMTVNDNWTPSQKFLQNANGPGNTWNNNGPMVNDTIKLKAGLQLSYQSLLKDKIVVNKNWPITREQPVIIELIKRGNQPIDIDKLRQVLVTNKINPASIYQWQNRTVIFDKVQDASVVRGKIKNTLPEVEIRIYYDPFYDFNRTHCSDTTTAKEWEHVILTANLVNNSKLQKEYMDYHATQFEEWPEVAKGFCNASFQQLLVYRSGRQLMLVISVPKGESLDKLNPKTTENNPRVDQWNGLMKKYQEGIEGTRPGETWVFLKKVEE